LQVKTANPNAMLADYFDMIAGTSTGGILTTLLLLPANEGDSKKGRYFASEAIDLYKKHGKAIFKKKLPLGGLSKVFCAIYTEKGIEEILKEKIGDVKLSEVRKPCLITAYDFNSREAKFFTSPVPEGFDNKNYYMRDIARSTSAAPTYFPPAKINSLSKKYAYLIDGGIYANDPTISTIVEARKNTFPNHDHPDFKEMYVLSVGTGKVLKNYDYDKVKKWGLLQWVAPIIDMMMSSSAEVVSYQVKKLFEAIDCPASYVRIDPDLCDANTDMDDASDKNIIKLENAGNTYVNNNIALLDGIVDELIKNG
jgi:patatin-like phospholipase/acyl hydrolase